MNKFDIDDYIKRKTTKPEYKTFSELKNEILSEQGIWIDELTFSTSNKEYKDLAKSLGAQVANNLCIFQNESDAILFKHSIGG